MSSGDADLGATIVQTEYSNNKLSVYDAYRFRAIVEETCERLELLGLVTMDTSRQRRDNDNKQGGGRKDVYHLMVNQKDLEEKYETLMQRRSQLRGLSNKSKYLQNQADLKKVGAALRESTTNIVQSLKDHPTVVSNIQKIQKDRTELEELLHSTRDDLKVDQFDSLVDQVNYRMEQHRLLWETQLAHEKTREALKSLEQELRAERDSFQHSIDYKNVEISELTGELKLLKKVTALSLKYERETALARQETQNRKYKRALTDMKAQINTTEQGLDVDTEVHKSTIDFLSKEQDGLHELLEQWESQKERDFGELEQEVEKITLTREEDQQHLVEFQRRWELDKRERTFKAEEKKQRQIEEQNKKKLQKIMNLAQAKIAFLYRVYNRKKPKGKKGKKGSKGSKKKKKK